MNEEILSSQIPTQEIPTQQPMQLPNPYPGITPAMLEQMKLRAREEAVRMAMEQRPPLAAPPQFQAPGPSNVVYVRRNLTVAELALVLLLACGIVTGVQVGFGAITSMLPRIEVKMK